MMLKLLIIGICVALCYGYERPYVGYKVLEITPNSDANSRILRSWELENEEFDFWSNHKGEAATVMIPPETLAFVLSEAAEHGMDVKVINEDAQKTVDAEHMQLLKNPKAYNRNSFNTLADIEAELQNLRSNFCPSGFTCELYNSGNSYEGRPINVLKISRGSGRQAIWIDSAIHAREWLAPATNMRVIDHLMKNYGVDTEVTRLLNNYDWYFVPMMNPDGYQYTWTNSRYWRKNRRPVGSGCFGADLNRNYNFRWGREGVSNNPCSDLYCGSRGGSEPETQVIQNELNRRASSIAAMVTIHAYGRMFMHPWGNTVNSAGWACERASDHNDMFRVATATANAIQSRYNTRWTRGTSCEVIYETTGGTDDYAKGVSGIKYSFCPELRGSDFVVSPSQIELSFQEFFAGMVAMADAL